MCRCHDSELDLAGESLSCHYQWDREYNNIVDKDIVRPLLALESPFLLRPLSLVLKLGCSWLLSLTRSSCVSAQISKSYSSADTHSRIQTHAPVQLFGLEFFTAFFLCMGGCTHTIRNSLKKLPARGRVRGCLRALLMTKIM